MTIRALIVAMLAMFAAVSVNAQQTSPQPPPIDADPGAVARYDAATAREKTAKQELDAATEMGGELHLMEVTGSDMGDSLKWGRDSLDQRGKALFKALDHFRASLDRRKAAVAAIDAYRNAAEAEFIAIKAYAVAGPDSATLKAQAADTAVDKKVTRKKEAEKAIEAASVGASGRYALFDDIRSYDLLWQVRVADLQRYSATMSESSGSTEKLARSLDRQLLSSIGPFLRNAKTRAASLQGHAAEMISQDRARMSAIFGKLDTLQKKELAELEAIRLYFENTVYLVVKSESYTFVQAVEKQAREHVADVRDAGIVTEVAASLESQRAQTDKVGKSLTLGFESDREAKAELENDARELSSVVGKVDALTSEATTVLYGFETAKVKVKETIEAKRESYRVAKEAAEKAYLSAYGKERVTTAMEAEPVPEPLPVAAPTPRRVSPPVPEQPIAVTDNVYAKVSALRGEPAGYGAYTYVLFRQTYDKAEGAVKQRYDALLAALYRNVTPAERYSAPVARNNLNLFCVPVKKEGSGDQYDSDLARSFIATAGSGALLRKEIASKLYNPGPFLLTTRTPLSGSSKTQVLFVDLSRYPAETIESVLNIYMQTLIQHPPRGQVVWVPPVTQRVRYSVISGSSAIPKLLNYIKDFASSFVSSTRATHFLPTVQPSIALAVSQRSNSLLR